MAGGEHIRRDDGIALDERGELGPRAGAALCAWFLVALYLQLFGASVMVEAIGLSLQTILAAYLSIRLKLSY